MIFRSGAAVSDRRRFPRTAFDPSLRARLGGMAARVVDLSVVGARVDHAGPLARQVPLRLTFDWYEPIEVDARVVRSEAVGRGLRSTLEIIVPSGSLVRSVALCVSMAKIARLESLVEASKLINSAIEPESLVEAILTVARSQLGVGGGVVYFVDHRSQEIWTDVAERAAPDGARFPIGTGLAGHVAASGDSMIIEDAHGDSRFDPAVDLVSAFGTGSMICVPVLDRDRTIVGVLQFRHEQHRSFSSDDLEFLGAISEQIAIAMRNAELLVDRVEKNRMRTELHLGREIQTRLLPQPPEDWRGVEVAVSSVPCFEVGGDYHDFIDLPGGDRGLAIGDVSGKGVAAALIMSGAQAALRVAAPTEPDLARLFARLDGLLHRTTPNTKFATFFFGRLSRHDGTLRYVNAGHNPPLVLTNGTLSRLESTGPPLGLMRDSHFREATVPFGIGSTLFLYTDGFSEAVNPEGEEFGTRRWESLVHELASLPVPEASRILTETIARFENGGRPSDDKTLVVLRRTK